jgi:hypothetical protein
MVSISRLRSSIKMVELILEVQNGEDYARHMDFRRR